MWILKCGAYYIIRTFYLQNQNQYAYNLQRIKCLSDRGEIYSSHLPKKGQWLVYSWASEENDEPQWALGKATSNPILDGSKGATLCGTLEDWRISVKSYVPQDYDGEQNKYQNGGYFSKATFRPELQHAERPTGGAGRNKQVTASLNMNNVVICSAWSGNIAWELSQGIQKGGTIKSKRPYIKNEIKFAIDHYSCIENHLECPIGVCRRAYDRVMVDLSEPEGENR